MYSCRVQCRLYISNMFGNTFSLKALEGNTVKCSAQLIKKIEIEPNKKNKPSFPFLSFSNKKKDLKLCSWVRTFEKSKLWFIFHEFTRCLFNTFLVFSSFKSWRQSHSPGLAGTRGGASHSRAGCPCDRGGAWGEGGVKQRETAENLGMEAPPL